MQHSKKTRGLAPASGAVEGFLQAQELAQALRPHLAKARWAEVVGPQVAGVTQVEAVRDGVLFVRVRNSVWANELTLLRDDMLRRLNAALGGRVLTDIHFKASGLARTPKAAEPRPVETPTDAQLSKCAVPADVQARIAHSTQGITEDALRERVRRAMLGAAQTDAWKRSRRWTPCARCGALTAPQGHSSTDAAADAPVLCELCQAGV